MAKTWSAKILIKVSVNFVYFIIIYLLLFKEVDDKIYNNNQNQQ